jgi:transmembrane sensor
VREAIIEQACAWYVRHRDGTLARAERAAFLEWLRASRLNMEEYLELVSLRAGLVQVMPSLALDKTALLKRVKEELAGNVLPISQEIRPLGGVRKHRWSFGAGTLAVAAGFVLVLIAGALWLAGRVPGLQWISVSRGEQRTVQLPDGSTMHLNASSQVRLRYTAHERLIDLDSGQALFEVAHDAVRPFRVRAGTTEVLAIGTQFDVYRKSTGTTVTVVEGKVEVVDRRWNGAAALAVPAEDDEPSSRAMLLTAGEQVQLGAEAAVPVAHPADIRAATAWMRRELIFKGEPLAQVVAELNRYVAVPVRIEDQSLSSMRIRGVFNAYDSTSFLAFLQQYDVEVQVGQDAIYVRRRLPQRPVATETRN